MFSFAMTSGLASDSDKFKIIITLRRAQKFGDTGPYKNFDSKKISIPNGTVMCLKSTVPVLGTLWGRFLGTFWGVPEMVTPAMRTTAVLLVV